MKTKLRTMLLAAAGVLGSVAVAHAQTAPDPAPPAPPAPVAPTPPEPASVAPAAMPAAPPPVAPAPVNWGGPAPAPTPAVDTTKPEAPKKANPFGFTRFTWNNSGTTRLFNIGSDYISSDDQVYSMDFGLNVRYTFFSAPKTKLFANVAGGVEVELTNGETKTIREPHLRDTSAGLGLTQKLFASADKETSTSLQVVGSALLPTSLSSRKQGRYLGSNLSASVFHSQKLAGSKSDWFPDVFLLGSVGWGHLFSRAYTPTSTELAVTQRPRQVSCNGEAGCSSDASDQLSGVSFAHDTLRLAGAFYFSVYKDVLTFGNYWEISERYKYVFADTCVNLPTTPGCEPEGRLADAVARSVQTTFDVSFSYNLLDNLGRVDFGYTNSANQIGENGLRRSVFYSPDAQFYVNLSAYLDGIYDKAASGKDAGTKQRIGALPRFNVQ